MNTKIVALAAISATAVAGCGSSSNSSSNSSKSSGKNATTSPTATTANSSGGKVGAKDRDYLIKTQQGALFEIMGGKLAQKNASSPIVKQYAKRLQTDHTNEDHAVSKVAGSLKVKLPTRPDNTEIKELQTISKYKGHRFDTAYLRLEIGDHRDDIQADHKEQAESKNPQTKAFATRWAAMYRTHLKLGIAAQKKVGGQP